MSPTRACFTDTWCARYGSFSSIPSIDVENKIRKALRVRMIRARCMTSSIRTNIADILYRVFTCHTLHVIPASIVYCCTSMPVQTSYSCVVRNSYWYLIDKLDKLEKLDELEKSKSPLCCRFISVRTDQWPNLNRHAAGLRIAASQHAACSMQHVTCQHAVCGDLHLSHPQVIFTPSFSRPFRRHGAVNARSPALGTLRVIFCTRSGRRR